MQKIYNTEAPVKHILGAMNPRFLENEIRKFPDHILGVEQAKPWPKLKGVVMVACTSRTGSTFVSRHAERAFDVHRVGESLNPIHLQMRRDLWGKNTLQGTLQEHIERRSSAGWYMFKAGGVGLANAVRIGFFDAYLDIIKPIFLLRRDILAQSLSLFFAQETRKFHSTDISVRQLSDQDYDFARIEQLMMTILRGNLILAQALTSLPSTPGTLLYEDFRNGDTSCLDQLLIQAGLPVKTSPAASSRKQVKRGTHDLTSRFRERFINEMGVRARNAIADHEYMVKKWVVEGLRR